MLIEALLNLIYTVLDFLFAPIHLPSLPEGVASFLASAMEYLQVGLSILAAYTDLNYLLALFGIIIAVDAAVLVYKLVMWILRKIPMLGIQ